jgi:hypothetical protein
MKQVYWKNVITGLEGHGNIIDDDAADAGVKLWNTKYPDIYHWSVVVYGTNKM